MVFNWSRLSFIFLANSFIISSCFFWRSTKLFCWSLNSNCSFSFPVFVTYQSPIIACLDFLMNSPDYWYCHFAAVAIHPFFIISHTIREHRRLWAFETISCIIVKDLKIILIRNPLFNSPYPEKKIKLIITINSIGITPRLTNSSLPLG
jgi:hypothetical protein